MDPKTEPKWTQNGPKMDLKMDPKMDQNRPWAPGGPQEAPRRPPEPPRRPQEAPRRLPGGPRRPENVVKIAVLGEPRGDLEASWP